MKRNILVKFMLLVLIYVHVNEFVYLNSSCWKAALGKCLTQDKLQSRGMSMDCVLFME
uniref:Uncharacterized protein n=1 Tax=Nelumbo nucifera TaxID=4432 RepID=A0A822ZMY4_NELNU|nr:TPA_asm: hypothetical protein HUJ06_001378 [Nelumbo nucifera]